MKRQQMDGDKKDMNKWYIVLVVTMLFALIWPGLAFFRSKYICTEHINRTDNDDSINKLFENVDYSQFVASSIGQGERQLNDHVDQKKRKTFIPPEEQGERYDGRETDFLCDRLRNGERIEQRKAALALWTRFGGEDVTLPEDVRQAVFSAVRRYLRGSAAGDFEENFLQLQRLWHLAAPELLEHITDKDWQVSDCAARALSLMKTRWIIDRLQERAERATAPLDLKKCIFALKYLQIHNHVLVEGRPRLSQEESERIYRDRVQPQVERLTRLLHDKRQPSN